MVIAFCQVWTLRTVLAKHHLQSLEIGDRLTNSYSLRMRKDILVAQYTLFSRIRRVYSRMVHTPLAVGLESEFSHLYFAKAVNRSDITQFTTTPDLLRYCVVRHGSWFPVFFQTNHGDRLTMGFAPYTEFYSMHNKKDRLSKNSQPDWECRGFVFILAISENTTTRRQRVGILH